jgi:hypothetical protein
MNKKVLLYFNLVKSSDIEGIDQIISFLHQKGASYAMTIRVLQEIGYELDKIDIKMSESTAWKNYNRSFGDLFFDFVELDNDLLED